MHAAILRHDGSPNVGDAIQTAAISRFFSSVTGVDRYCTAARTNREIPLVVNGWLGQNVVDVQDVNVLFAGIHVHDNESNYEWVRNSRYPVGARDPHALAELRRRGVDAELIGCATLTFEPYAGERAGVLAVDAEHPGAVELTHRHRAEYRFQWKMGLALLQQYRTAAAVYTSRLHVALPCLAFGTPVAVMSRPLAGSEAAARFSLLDEMGFQYGRLNVMDVGEWRWRYAGFLKRSLGEVVPRGPIYPEQLRGVDCQ